MERNSTAHKDPVQVLRDTNVPHRYNSCSL